MELDSSRSVRKGEELDQGALQAYLQESLDLTGELVITQFPGGFSNLTYLLQIGARQLVLRRPPFGANIKSAHDMAREFRFLQALEKPFGKVPKALTYCDDENVIGAPFYIMEKVDGVILRGSIPPETRPTSDQMATTADATIGTLSQLHSLNLDQHGLSELGKPEGYVHRQIEGWTKRYRNSATDDHVHVEQMIGWLHKNLPKENAPALIHNDFKYDNLLLDPNDLTKVLAVLDWEMATVGDPLMDLGTTLGYWIENGDPDIMKNLNLSPSYWPGNPNRIQVAEKYAEITGVSLDNVLFYYIYGLFKIAVIVQQIYFRYKKGLTRDERFAHLNHAVIACGLMGVNALDRDKISA